MPDIEVKLEASRMFDVPELKTRGSRKRYEVWLGWRRISNRLAQSCCSSGRSSLLLRLFRGFPVRAAVLVVESEMGTISADISNQNRCVIIGRNGLCR